jgi:hypothetical protein
LVEKALVAVPFYQHANPAFAVNARDSVHEDPADQERGA